MAIGLEFRFIYGNWGKTLLVPAGWKNITYDESYNYFQVFRYVQSYFIKYLFNYTNQMLNMYLLHIFTITYIYCDSATRFGVTYTIIREKFVSYLNP
jgi:hypothetical protein